MPLDMYETIEPERFDPERYMLANVDLQRAGVDGREHYEAFGKNEGRRQISEAVMPGSAYRRHKFERFRHALDLTATPGSAAFPIFTGERHFTLTEYQAESANALLPAFEAALQAEPAGRYLDLGCGMRDRVFENCLYLEVYPSLTADIIVDANEPYPIQDRSLDGIGCFAVLEHCRRPWEIVSEISRMLKPGGRVWIDWPFLQPVHGYPSHFFNATRQGLRTIFEDAGFAVTAVDTLAHQGPDATIAWVLGELLRRMPETARANVEGMRVKDLLAQPTQGPVWTDLLRQVPAAVIEEFACGNTLIATKT